MQVKSQPTSVIYKKIPAYFGPFSLIFAILVIFTRDISLFTNPRFWAEEGNVYFSYAFSHSWADTLVSPHLGYYSLFVNLVSLLASKVVPLEFAPLVTTFAAFLIQLIPLSIVILGKSLFWEGWVKRSLVILIVLFTMLSNEIWLNTINSHFYLSLSTFLILIEELDDIPQYRAWLYRFILLLAGLTGPVGCFLTPLFFYRAWVQKKRESIIQAGLLAACTIFQIVTIGLITVSDTSAPGRFAGFNIAVFIQTVFIKNVLLPFLGPNVVQIFSEVLKAVDGASLLVEILVSLVILLLTIVFFYFLTKNLPVFQIILVLGAFLFITITSFISSIGDKTDLINPTTAHRYFYTPNVIVLLLVLFNIDFSKIKVSLNKSFVCVCLLSMALFIGSIYFYLYHSHNNSGWTQEVEKWENNPNYALKISPDGWTIELKK